MAITTNAICNSFKKELLQGKHDFDTSSDTYKLAMYTSAATLGASTKTMQQQTKYHLQVILQVVKHLLTKV
jgi:hypothetical protein